MQLSVVGKTSTERNSTASQLRDKNQSLILFKVTFKDFLVSFDNTKNRRLCSVKTEIRT